MAPHCHRYVVMSVFWVLAILSSMQLYHSVVLVCNSLVAYAAEHLFMNLSAFCASFLTRDLFRSLAYFLPRLFPFLSLRFWSSSNSWTMVP